MSVTTNSDAAARAQVLIVEDEPEHADVMAEALRKPGHVCTVVHGVAAALEELAHGAFDVIVTDLRMPASAGDEGVGDEGADAGMVVLRRARELQPEAETIMVTAHGDVPTARAAFKHGAYDFIEKPLDLAVFRALVNRAAETVLLRHQAEGLEDLVQHEGFEGLIAGSEPMRRIIQTVRTVAASNLPVLITGESGVGKELIAQAVHRNSPRSGKRFVAFNCAGQSESLLEDSLFGHVRGAFTGADKDREGVFEYANGGTIFLDEIGDMPLPMQAKLLRVLESGEVVRLGANEARRVDVRFVSATNKDLENATQDASFRQDLYFRIKGAHVHVPPLRDRREDIPRIVRHAVAKYAHELRKDAPPPDVSDAAMMRLTAFAWPGNVRQLLNVVQNMVVTSAGESPLDVRHIPPEITSADNDDEPTTSGGSLAGANLEQLEKRAIRETLRLTGGNREQTAKLLGIGERTLYRKLKEYGLR
ncbi:MAG: sigma-54-dependent Fis family transcriptional regulator [Phycisphaerales bacterium]|nr:MAG: sigma-54-dependent Fis family transcriptional regulator [Phycisphaerales bacterium]